MQQGIITSHAPVFGFWLFVLLLVPLFFWPKATPHSRVLFVLSSVSLLLLVNQQVITGFYLQPAHFHWYVTKPLVGLMLGVWIVYLAERFIPLVWIRRAGYTALVAVLLLQAALAQKHFYSLHSPEATAAQSYAPLLAYFKTNPQTVFADQSISTYLSIYTSSNAPNNVSSGLYIAPPQYLSQELFLEYRLRGTTPAGALATFTADRATITVRLKGIYGTMSDQELAALADAYKSAYVTTVPQLMQNLGIQAVAIDRHNDNWDASKAGLQLKTTIEDRFTVWSF
jgi:hypothetical protein